MKEHQKRQLLAPCRCPQTRERFSYNGFYIFRFFEFPAFYCTNRGKLTLGSYSVGKNTSITYFWVFFGGYSFRDDEFNIFFRETLFSRQIIKIALKGGGVALGVQKFF